ncbi:hypothetical protein R6Z07M_019705 [Ovis aries]
MFSFFKLYLFWPVVRARPADPATLGPAFHSPGSRVGGKERRGSRAWLPAKAAAFGPGATGGRAWAAGGRTAARRQLSHGLPQLPRRQDPRRGHLRRLYDRFQALDRTGKGYLSRLDLQQIRALAVNPLGDRIIDSFFPDGSLRLDFPGFVRVLAHFRPVDEEDEGNRDPKEPEPLNSRMNKLRFAFQLYDLDRDGKISRHEMLQALRLMVGVQVTEEQLESIADRTVQEADEDGDGAVSFLEFAKSLEKMNIEQKMSIRILK